MKRKIRKETTFSKAEFDAITDASQAQGYSNPTQFIRHFTMFAANALNGSRRRRRLQQQQGESR